MKIFPTFNDFISVYDDILNWNTVPEYSVFIIKNDKLVNYGQTGRIYRTLDLVYFQPDGEEYLIPVVLPEKELYGFKSINKHVSSTKCPGGK